MQAVGNREQVRRGRYARAVVIAVTTGSLTRLAVEGSAFITPFEDASWSRRSLLLTGFAALSPTAAKAAQYEENSLSSEVRQKEYFGGSLTNFTKLDSGLLLFDRKVGTGAKCCSDGATAVVDWYLRRLNGAPLEATTGISSKDMPTEARPPPFKFIPKKLVEGIREVGMRDDVVEAFREGVYGMKVGGSRRIIVPPILGWRSPDQEPKPVDEARFDRLSYYTLEPLVVDLQLRAVSS